jgi:hypothetical protein
MIVTGWLGLSEAKSPGQNKKEKRKNSKQNIL